MHHSDYVREPVIEAFDCGNPAPEVVVENLGGPTEARRVLGRLWNCSDTLPGFIVDAIRTDWPDANEEMKRNTFGSLAQWMYRQML